MYGELVAAVNSLKALSDIGKGLMSLHTMAEVQGKAIELNQIIFDAQQALFSAQAAQSALVNEVRDLKGQIAAMENWNAEKERYQMVSPFKGGMAYAVKKAMSNGEPPHYLCANCFQDRKRSILQNAPNKDGWTSFVCFSCKTSFSTGWRGPADAKYAEEVPTK